MKDKSAVAFWMDGIIYSLIGISSLLYIYYDRHFAETTIHVNGLGFPIFIGEIILAGVFLLCLLRQWILKEPFLQKYVFWIIFGCVILVKAGRGYFIHGPLALRDAALCYYSFFALITFHCFNPTVLKRFYPWVIGIVLGGWFFHLPGNYWVWGYSAVGWLAIRQVSHQKLRWGLYALLGLLIPYTYLFHTSRMMVLANLCSLAAVVVCLILLNGNRIGKTKIITALAVLFFCVGYELSGNPKVLTIFKASNFFETYNLYSNLAANRLKTYQPLPIKPKIYNPQSKSSTEAMPVVPIPAEVVKVQPPSSPKASDRKSKKNTAISFSTNTPSNDVPLDALKSMISQFVVDPTMPDTHAYNDAIFRVFIWQDMWDDLREQRPIFGFDFGKPLRSKRIEVLGWGMGEWSRDGWVAAHNSYFNLIYRLGILGVILIGIYFWMLGQMGKVFFKAQNWEGIVLFSVVLGWSLAANFLLIFELPYTAIPFWSLVGITKALADHTALRDKRA
jgi:hypothetical protein